MEKNILQIKIFQRREICFFHKCYVIIVYNNLLVYFLFHFFWCIEFIVYFLTFFFLNEAIIILNLNIFR